MSYSKFRTIGGIEVGGAISSRDEELTFNDSHGTITLKEILDLVNRVKALEEAYMESKLLGDSDETKVR